MSKKTVFVLTVLLCAAMLLSACSTRESAPSHELVTQATTAQLPDTTGFKLSYSQSDSLDPFASDTLNNQVVQDLVFDSLFAMDDSFRLQRSIATSYSYESETKLSVTIPQGILFSDGTELTAKHVVNSFNEAKSAPHYQNGLKAIASAHAVNDNTIEFQLNGANPYAHQLLTFAIAKGDTDKKGYPIGSGRYRFNDANGMVFLEVNEHCKDFSPRFTKIPLVNITAAESIENAINIGNISYAFLDLATAPKTKMQCNKKAVNLNNLVYVGMNAHSGITANANIRRAISLAIDRDTLVKSAYQGYGKSAVSVFTTASSLGKKTTLFSAQADLSAARQEITQSGYEEKKLKLDILTNENANRYAAAQLMKQQLEAAGFKVTINQEKNKTYQAKVKSRSFDIYIGETRIPNDMSLNSFFSQKGATHYGIDLDEGKTAKAYQSYQSGKNEIGSFMLAFSQEMPFAPLLYRQGMICYAKSLHGDMQGYADNYFANIEDWYYN